MFKRTASAIIAVLVASGSAAVAEEITIATNIANVPFEFEDASGKLQGFEVDLVDLIAARINKTAKFTQMPFNSLFSAVQSSRADIAIGSITITSKRLESVSFTQPFYDADQCLTVATSGGIEGFDGLEGKDVAVITGTTGEIWASDNEAKHKFGTIKRYDGNAEPMLDIATGRISGFIHDCPIDAYYIRDKPQYKIVATIPTNEQFGLMLRKDSPLLNDVNEAITALKNEGEMERLHKKWFGTDADADSSTLKVHPIPTN
ncbi:ABC transporter substrate-binding protein [Falsochrobactrum sp. TDYN1]|uniref:ABC transporter substrate-binding protein n=1 Tax=Falsochrobactrum tianjinense TaxID=2706015 RepID=A0A949UUF0_9HYPH|nr:ABC transporter substrate-binding protein [Falsochrobactrum sp. TDYN1]MBV2143023.1 ABC transporter substrate-binding protein [Falsochrobactrum sp. TDYN1]